MAETRAMAACEHERENEALGAVTRATAIIRRAVVDSGAEMNRSRFSTTLFHRPSGTCYPSYRLPYIPLLHRSKKDPMDTSSLAALISLYIFPTGRRTFALGQVATRAKARDFPELAKHCSGAITHDRECLTLERRWDGVVAESKGKVAPSPPAAGAPPNAADVDPLVDKTLTAIRDHAVSQTAGAAPDDPIHAIVAAFLKVIYPAGVAEVTKLGFVEELAAVDVIVGLLQSKELGPVVKDLGLGRLVKRLADLAVVYRASQLAQPEGVLAFSNVRVAQIKGQDLLLEAIAIVLGKHHSSSPEDVAARSDLLGPILEQNDAIGAALKGRRSVADVNPDTGAADPSVPAPAEAPAAPAAPAAVGTGTKTP